MPGPVFGANGLEGREHSTPVFVFSVLTDTKDLFFFFYIKLLIKTESLPYV